MGTSHQERSFNEMNGARPCCFRGPLELDVKHVPASPCCQARDIVKNATFYCKLLDKTIASNTTCWTCQQRKESGC
jgi:hypothetical protein